MSQRQPRLTDISNLEQETVGQYNNLQYWHYFNVMMSHFKQHVRPAKRNNRQRRILFETTARLSSTYGNITSTTWSLSHKSHRR